MFTPSPSGAPIRRTLSLACALAAVSAVLLGACDAAGAASPAWRFGVPPVATAAARVPEGGLDSVSCPRATVCVATGWTAQAAWNTTAWHDITGTQTPFVVDCVAANYCFATDFIEGTNRPYRWNGHTWAPGPVAGDTFTMYDVACKATTFCLLSAAGGADGDTPRLYRWDGTAWSATAIPADTWFYALDCPSTTACVATTRVHGAQKLMRWDGTSWTVMPGKLAGDLRELDCPTPAFCMGVGTDPASGRSWAATWNGTTWAPIVSPLTTRPTLAVLSVACGTDQLCVVLAGRPDGTHAEILRWNGSRWAIDALPAAASERFVDVACAGKSFCVVVGSRQKPGDPFTNQPYVGRWALV
jgi:uncharacterized membrane protein